MKKGYPILLILIMMLIPGCKKAPADTIADAEGNVYKTVKIGKQIWLSENLKSTRFNDGTEIPLVKDSITWSNNTNAGYCWYNNDDSYRDQFGALYNGFTVSTGKLCPAGWHVPDNEEWIMIRDLLGDSLNAGGKLKVSGSDNWLSSSKGATNTSGFTAVGAGLRYFQGTFASVLTFTSFWSSSVAPNDEEWYVGLYYADPSFTIDHRNKKHGFSVRCMKTGN